MENNDAWMLRSAWLSQPSSVNKLLREGFEPFWGFRVTGNDIPRGKKQEADTRMYFRKPPETNEVVSLEELPAIKTDPITFDLTPLDDFSNKLQSLLNATLNEFTEKFFERLAEFQSMTTDKEPLRRIVDELKNDDDSSGTSERVELDEGESGEHETPAGDGFRPLSDREEVPVITTKNRTPQQDQTIESLKNKHGNISILTGGEGGAIRVMAGTEIYTVGLGGNFTVEDTGSNASALGV